MADSISIGAAYRDQKIDGGVIDNTVIGGTTAAAGTFTTMTATTAVIDGSTINGTEMAFLDGALSTNLVAEKAAILGASGALTIGGALTAVTSIGIGSAVLLEAEMELLDGITAGTLAASKAWTSDSSLDTIMPTGGLLTVQSGGGVTFNSGSTLTNNATVVRTAQSAEHGAGAIGTSSFGAPQTRRWIDAGVIVTQIKFDLTGLASVATANDVIGLSAGGAAYIGRNVVATNGVIFKTTIAVLETPAGGDNDVNLVTSSNAALAYDGAGGTTYLVGDLGDLLVGKSVENLVPALTEGDYYYLTAGTGDTAAAYTAGQYVLTTYGHAVLA